MSEADNQTDHNHPTGDGPAQPEGKGSASEPVKPGLASDSVKAKSSVKSASSKPPTSGELEKMDPGSEALTEALRISFGVLKIVMVAVIGLFIWSGAYTVGANERAIELRFGKIKGVGPEAIIGTGLHWKWPAPIEEVIKLPLLPQPLEVNAFWHNQPEDSQINLPTLRFGVDGYCVTASSGVANMISSAETPELIGGGTSSEVTDYNLVHTNWQMTYKININDSEGPRKLVERLWDGTEGSPGEGDGWFEVRNFLHKVVCDAVVSVSVQWDIERILWGEDYIAYRAEVQRRIEERLAEFDVGIVVDSLNLVNREPPRQLKDYFAFSAQARSEKPRMENEAKGRASELLSQAQADADILLSEASAYKNTKVSEASADALYMDKVLATIEDTAKNLVGEDQEDYLPKRQAKKDEILVLVLKEMRHQMLRGILQRVEETIVVPAMDELRFHLNRDASIKPMPGEKPQSDIGAQLYHDPMSSVQLPTIK